MTNEYLEKAIAYGVHILSNKYQAFSWGDISKQLYSGNFAMFSLKYI